MRAFVCLWQPMCTAVAYLTFAAGKVTEGQLLLAFTSHNATTFLISDESVHRTVTHIATRVASFLYDGILLVDQRIDDMG